THGNGPQVGLLALQAASYDAVAPYPLDVLGAETEGMIGYMLALELENARPGRPIATLLTRTRVDAADPAMAAPTKFVGPIYRDDAQAQASASARGWTLGRDGAHLRRVVPSPAPKEIIELAAIRLLVDHGVLVVCAGGGGIPVTRDQDGALVGVEAVVDKDRASALLAAGLGADGLLLLTDVDAVYDQHGAPAQAPIRRATPASLGARSFPAGSMGPKVEAACQFVEGGGRFAAIGALADAAALVTGEAGTRVEKDMS
ncbi:MAG: carbamate kinase, partial [Myxococcales bacterium]|nr:carbamate kinase [Myxococcales bacterium]